MNKNQPNFDFATSTIVYYQISYKDLSRTSDKHLAVIERSSHLRTTAPSHHQEHRA